MADTVNVMQDNNNTENTQERTFTQAEVNSIIENRLRKESAKYADYETLKAKALKFDEAEEANKSELQKATEKAAALQGEIDKLTKANEIRSVREKVAQDTGVPAQLLMGDTEESCVEQAKAILAFKDNKSAYPSVRDGGEVQNNSHNLSEQEQFAEWLNASLKN